MRFLVFFLLCRCAVCCCAVGSAVGDRNPAWRRVCALERATPGAPHPHQPGGDGHSTQLYGERALRACVQAFSVALASHRTLPFAFIPARSAVLVQGFQGDRYFWFAAVAARKVALVGDCCAHSLRIALARETPLSTVCAVCLAMPIFWPGNAFVQLVFSVVLCSLAVQCAFAALLFVLR